MDVLGFRKSNFSLILIPYMSSVGICFIDVLNKLLIFKIISDRNFVYYINKYTVRRNRKIISII
jgi:hypothetical protein